MLDTNAAFPAMARTDDQPAEETAETSVDREQGGAQRMLRKERLGARLTRYFGAEVSTEHADVLMLSCCLISGFIDSTVYNGMLAAHVGCITRERAG